MRIETPQQLTRLRKDCLTRFNRHPQKIHVCCGPGCLANGAQKVSDELKKVIKKKRLKGFSVDALKETGCHGFCEQGPLVVVEPAGTFYTRVKVKDVEEIIDKTVRKKEVLERLLFTDPQTGEKIENYRDIPFYARQQRIALRNIGQISQCDIDEYIAVGGYLALAKALKKMSPQDVID